MRHPTRLLYALLISAAPVGAVAQDTSNLLRPGDEVLIRVWPDTSLTGRYRVEMDGRAYLPMLGAVSVSFRPLEDLRAELIERYAQIMQAPVVVVVPRFRVSILGGVRGPGLYFVETPTTLMDLVSMAGGFTERAKPAEVSLIRGTDVFRVDAKSALETGAPTAAVSLESGDRVVVPTSGGIPVLQVLQMLVSLATLASILAR